MIVDARERDSVLLGEDATQLGLPVWKVKEVGGHEGNALIDTSPTGNVLQNDAWLEARKQAEEYLAILRPSSTEAEILRETRRRYSLQIKADISRGLLPPARDFWFARGPTSFLENGPFWICDPSGRYPIQHTSAVPRKKFLEVIRLAKEVIATRASNQDRIELAYSQLARYFNKGIMPPGGRETLDCRFPLWNASNLHVREELLGRYDTPAPPLDYPLLTPLYSIPGSLLSRMHGIRVEDSASQLSNLAPESSLNPGSWLELVDNVRSGPLRNLAPSPPRLLRRMIAPDPSKPSHSSTSPLPDYTACNQAYSTP